MKPSQDYEIVTKIGPFYSNLNRIMCTKYTNK